MPKFTVEFTQHVRRSCTVEVEAPDEDALYDMISEGKVDTDGEDWESEVRDETFDVIDEEDGDPVQED